MRFTSVFPSALIIVSLMFFFSCNDYTKTIHQGVPMKFKSGNCHSESGGKILSGGGSYEVCEIIFTFVVNGEEEEVSIHGEMAKRIVKIEPHYGDEFVGVVEWSSHEDGDGFRLPNVLDVVPISAHAQSPTKM